jgi:hypothetical protein
VLSALFILAQSPFSPGSIQYPSTESSLYLYVGSQVLDGNMPYRDIFDFHAPLVFLINALGLLISNPFGIWVLELHFLVGTFLVIFAVLNRSVGPVAAFIACVILAALIASGLEGGNRVEEYALLFQALGLAGFVDCLTKRRFTLLNVYLIGLSVALTFWLKPVLTVFWLPFLLLVLILLLKKEGVGLVLTRLLTIIFSAALVFIAIIPWLYMNNALASCYRQVVQFYQDYVGLVTVQQQVDALWYFGGSLPFVLIVFISLALIVRLIVSKVKARLDDTPFGRNTLLLLITNLIAAFLILLVTALGGRTDGYLGLPLLVCLAVPLATLIHRMVLGFRNKEVLRAVFGLALVVLLTLSTVMPSATAILEATREQRVESPALIEQRELVAALRGYERDGAPFIVFGDDCWIYTAVDSYSATRYAYQPFNEQFRPDLQADFYRQVKIADSLLLVGRSGEDLIERYPNIDAYELVFENPSYKIYHRLEG